ncbi:glycine cleavage system aminomethyltransferase GcvT [Tomitella fengzijianii]|uniref:aminomethyltransferase n=1 Tax=Tomitella fengzijianii TaxID=2597660 RepID=A0A516X8B5_9ACTN|nr:glycine cleavage system aminomethyltransferase GcvT [Tomitella fengzijianii]QDQ99308.1 glycine cleavage system aminomethyltransferase GcvT [Tomitella fengzijianii]
MDFHSTDATDRGVLRGPLHDRHAALGADFGEFGGWDMPMSFTGVVAEHNGVRERVGIFDVSHLGKLTVRGPDAAGYVDTVLTADLGAIGDGAAQYTLCCTEDGGVTDDMLAYRVGPGEVFLVPNAANARAVAEVLRAGAPAGIEVVDEHRGRAVLAVQGPRSPAVLAAAGLPTEIGYMRFTDLAADFGAARVDVRVGRTGYTGELGYEVIVPWARAGAVFDALHAAVEEQGGVLAGLAARDTLRTEMAYPLHGHELSERISPLEARCGWAVAWDKPAFRGRAALQEMRAAGAPRRLRALRALGRGIPRPGHEVRDEDGTVLGVCTSGTFSPTLGAGIALALMDAQAAPRTGDTVTVDVRGRGLRCEVVAPPFVPSRVR